LGLHMLLDIHSNITTVMCARILDVMKHQYTSILKTIVMHSKKSCYNNLRDSVYFVYIIVPIQFLRHCYNL
jgi:hypothetical protein